MGNYLVYLRCNKNWTRGSQSCLNFLIFQLPTDQEKWYYILQLQIHIFERADLPTNENDKKFRL